jgi:hypothetical protein
MDHPQHTVLLETLRQQHSQDPLIEARIGAREISSRLLHALATPAGVHLESLLAVSGGLAGYATQMSLRARARQAGVDPSSPFHTIRTGDGRRFVVGEVLSCALTADPYSIWRLAAAEALHGGCRELPDLGELFAHGIEALGTEHFGRPKVPDRHQPSQAALTCLADVWPLLFPLARAYCPDAQTWPILFAIAAQQAMAMGRERLDPAIALRIVMDSAIAQSKLILPDN